MWSPNPKVWSPEIENVESKSYEGVQKVLQLDHKEEWKCYKLHFIRPPVYGSNGRTYKMLVMFFFRHAFSEFPRPITLKLCHLIGICVYLIMQVQKLGGTPPKKSGGQKHAKFRSILDHFRL